MWEAKKHADIVFRGTIIDIRDRTVFFRVDRKWKGNVGRDFTMPEIRESSGCVGFWSSLLKVGSDLLVYGQRGLNFKREDYFTSICTRTREAKDAWWDFFWLGLSDKPSN